MGTLTDYGNLTINEGKRERRGEGQVEAPSALVQVSGKSGKTVKNS